MNMGERIKQLRQEKGLTQEELGKYLGVKKAAIMKYEKGNVKNIKRSAIEILSNLFDVSPSYLMCLEDSKLDKYGNTVVPINILGVVKAGYDYLAEENIIGTVDVEGHLVGNGEDYFALKVKGDSMSPVFLEDDIVIIKKQNDCENNEFAVVIINGDEGTLKRVKKTDSSILLQPLNPAYEPLLFTKEEVLSIPVSIIGVVKELKRRF